MTHAALAGSEPTLSAIRPKRPNGDARTIKLGLRVCPSPKPSPIMKDAPDAQLSELFNLDLTSVTAPELPNPV